MSTLLLFVLLGGCGLLAVGGSLMLTDRRPTIRAMADDAPAAAMATVTGTVRREDLQRARNMAHTAVQPRRRATSRRADRSPTGPTRAEWDALRRRCHALEVDNQALREQVERLKSGIERDRSGYDPAVIRRIASTTDELRGLLTEVEIGYRP